MSQNTNAFIQQLDAVIERHSMLRHPFYQLWNEGKLTPEVLAEYAKQYYAHVRNFPVYLSAVHSRCTDEDVRLLLLENLMEEEWGEENHPELWMRFADSLAVPRPDVRNARLLAETETSVNTMKELTTRDNFVEGVAALYAYESQVPEIAKSKREGLQAFYNMNDERSVSYFTVHEAADIEHSEAERRIIAKYAADDDSRKRILNAAETAAKAMWIFLDGLFETYIDDKTKARFSNN